MTTRPDDVSLDELAALFVAARDGRPGAFDQLIAACWPVVEREARRHTFRSADDDDVVQEVWVRLVEHAATIRDPRALLGWLIMVTRRTAAEIGRRHGRLVPAELDEQPTATSTEDQVLDAEQVHETTVGVRSALGRLTAGDRNLLLLLIGDGPPNYREASRQLHRPVGSLGPTRRRLLERLRNDPSVRDLRAVG
jgi:RNA polymerase sigma factor (sigma-70 family)